MTKNWYPTIDYKKCIGCLACVKFCPHKVYSERDGKPFVKNKEACVEGCRGCEKVCPKKAITHQKNAMSEKKSPGCSCGGKESASSCSCGGNCQ